MLVEPEAIPEESLWLVLLLGGITVLLLLPLVLVFFSRSGRRFGSKRKAEGSERARIDPWSEAARRLRAPEDKE